MTQPLPFTERDLATCTLVLDHIAQNFSVLQHHSLRALRKSLAPVAEYVENQKYGGKGRKRYIEDQQLQQELLARQQRRKIMDEHAMNETTLRKERMTKLQALIEQQPDSLPLIPDGPVECTKPPIEPTDARVLHKPRRCYICKHPFDQVHHFYDQLCPSCAALNFTKRFQTADLRGKVALVTGARVKIGFQVARKLLESGATVIATTRFPTDARKRFQADQSYDSFKDRLHIVGLDFCDFTALERFLAFVQDEFDRLDVIIHNACQTIQRPAAYYKTLVQQEMAALTTDSNTPPQLTHFSASPQRPLLSTSTGALDVKALFPEGVVDVHGQQVDLRSTNSWMLTLSDIEPLEVLQVFAINAIAPFIINSRLVPLMEKKNTTSFIVNVSSMEGKFYRPFKSPCHPHTNMAKAALNMMTRTCAEDLSKRKIYMNSVDTGWINAQQPLPTACKLPFQPPLDEIDAAARILDLVFTGFSSNCRPFGKFFKDYQETEW